MAAKVNFYEASKKRTLDNVELAAWLRELVDAKTAAAKRSAPQ